MGQISIEKAAYKPFCVLLQNELEQAAIHGIFAGIKRLTAFGESFYTN